MRNRILILVAAALLLAIPALAQTVPEYPLPRFDWDRDAVHHWQLNADGEVVNQGVHAFDEMLLCTVCTSEVLDWGDGTFDVTSYDAFGNATRITSFDADGAITNDIAHHLEYSEEGIALLDREFYNGVLYGETVYTVNADGEQIPVTQTAWNDDGTTSVNKYDENGNCISAAIYEADGALINETISEYAKTEDEWFGVWYYECKTTTRFASGESFYTETNEHNDTTRNLNTHADGTVWADTVYEYKYNNSDKVWRRMYSFGVLTRETFYNEEGSTVKEIEHLEDGSTETSLYDENGDTTSVTYTLPDGSIDRVETYVYEYAGDMSILCMKVYSDNKLLRQVDYLYDDEFSMTGSVETTWNQDGSRTVSKYDEWLELVSEVTYDAQGNAVN